MSDISKQNSVLSVLRSTILMAFWWAFEKYNILGKKKNETRGTIRRRKYWNELEEKKRIEKNLDRKAVP